MNCLINYNEQTKQIIVSSDTKCEWSCAVTNGNITLSDYYGNLNNENNYSNSAITIYTYGTDDMYGDIMCRFQNNNGCMVKKKLTIQPSPLHVFSVSQKNIILFGKNTKSYIYVYYGTLNQNDPNILNNISLMFGGVTKDEYEYNGNYSVFNIDFDGVDLYKIELQKYNEKLKYFEIIVTSLTNYIFNDIIFIKGINDNNEKQIYTINLVQTKVENTPTLLKISPSIVFLNSKNPKQKITVMSLYEGAYKDYYITNTLSNTHSELIATNDIEEYLNSSTPSLLRNDELDVTKIINEKNASHFIIDMSPYDNENNDNADNNEFAYQLYVVQNGNPNCFQKLEFFYDYIFDPSNFIKIIKIEGIYGYKLNDSFISINEINEDIIEQFSSLTLYFIKRDYEDSSNFLKNCVYVKYSETENVKLTVKSTPNWWKIYTESEYVKEVKLNDQLHISLESIIPENEETWVSLQNEKGSICTIFCKSDNDIFNSNINTFKFNDNLTSVEINIGDSAETCNLISYTTEEQWYYFDKEFTINSIQSTISLETIKYKKNENNILEEDIFEYEFPIYFNYDINKYYVLYGSLTETNYNNTSIIEFKDSNKYYFVKNKTNYSVIIPIPKKTKFVPWSITNNGCGIKYQINVIKEEKWDILNVNEIFLPQSESVTIYCLKELPKETSDYKNAVVLTPILQINGLETKSAIIFQQMNTLQEVTLYINLSNNKNETQYINKYGILPSLSSMKDITYNSLIEAFNSEDVIQCIVEENYYNELYYSSYIKINSFTTQKNNVSFSLLQTGTTQNEINIMKDELTQKNGKLKYVELTNSEKPNDENFWFEMTTNTNINGNIIKTIDEWKLSDGILNYKINNVSYEIFPQNNKIDGENKKGVIFEDNDYNENDKKRYFAIILHETNYLNINGNSYLIESDEKDKKYINYDCLYETLNKTISFGGDEIYEIDQQNIVLYDNNGNLGKYIAYEENEKWYVNLPSATFKVYTKEENNTTLLYFILKGKEEIIGKDLTYIYDSVTYNVNVKINLKYLILNVLTNIDNNNEKYIIINNKKYVANENKIQLNPNVVLTVNENDEGSYVIFDDDYFVDLIIEPSYQFIKINGEIKQLTSDGLLIYEGEKYVKEKYQSVDYVFVQNKGYKVQTKNSEYYLILNFNKYKYENYNLNIKSFSGKTDEYIIEEITNEKFIFNLNFDDLLSDNIITGLYVNNENKYDITNGYVAIDEDTFFDDKTYPIKKDIWLKTDTYPYQMVAEEFVKEISVKDNVNNNSVTLIFYDDTEIIWENKNVTQVKLNDLIKFDETSAFTINDYSKIEFSGSTFITFKNDCTIEIVGDVSETLKILNNETLFINDGVTIIFNDITKLELHKENKMNMYVFNDVVSINNETYIATMINNQKAIQYLNDIYYVYDNKITIIGKNGEVYNYDYFERSIFYKKIELENNNPKITSKIFKINDFYKDLIETKTEKTYGYVYNENGKYYTKNLPNLNEKIQYFATVPCFKDADEKWNVTTLEIKNISIYVRTDNNNNQITTQATIENHPNFPNKNLNIENGVLEIEYSRYKGINSNKNVIYLSKEDTISGESIWDYYTNTYAKKIIVRNFNDTNLIINKNITLNNIKYEVDLNQYMKIQNQYHNVYAKNILDVTTLTYDNNICKKQLTTIVNNKIISKNYEFRKNNDKYYIKPGYSIYYDENKTEEEIVNPTKFEYIISTQTETENNITETFVFYNNKEYSIKNGITLITQKCYAHKYNAGFLIELDISAYLTHNFYLNFSNEKQGNIDSFSVRNALSMKHGQYISIKVQNGENYKYGIYYIIFN